MNDDSHGGQLPSGESIGPHDAAPDRAAAHHYSPDPDQAEWRREPDGGWTLLLRAGDHEVPVRFSPSGKLERMHPEEQDLPDESRAVAHWFDDGMAGWSGRWIEVKSLDGSVAEYVLLNEETFSVIAKMGFHEGEFSIGVLDDRDIGAFLRASMVILGVGAAEAGWSALSRITRADMMRTATIHLMQSFAIRAAGWDAGMDIPVLH